MTEKQRIGFIGAGNIGGGIAANLVADGHQVTVHDKDPQRLEPLVRAGARAAGSAAEVARSAAITFMSLPTPPIMDAVSREWLEAALADSVLVDLTTNAPATVRAIGARLSGAGRHLLECPLTGGAPGARARMLVFMVGGERAIYERCAPLLATIGRASFYMGPLGS